MAVFVPDSYEVDALRRLRSALLDSHSAVVWNRIVVEEPCVNRRIGLSPFWAAPLAHYWHTCCLNTPPNAAFIRRLPRMTGVAQSGLSGPQVVPESLARVLANRCLATPFSRALSNQCKAGRGSPAIAPR